MNSTLVLFALSSLFLTPAFAILSHCIRAPSLFALHPAANAVAHLILCPAAIYLMIERKSVADHKTRTKLVKTHFALQLLAFVLMGVGGAAAYMTKEQYNKPHFASTHSWFAGVFSTLWSLNLLGGLATTFLGKSANWQWKNPGHRIGGVLSFVGCGVTAVYGVYSGSWGAANLGSEKQLKVALLIGAAYAGLFIKALANFKTKPHLAKKDA
ncbi:hypothetical protein P43SY_004221 [Pythium insidiosum]|uniref:Cytochrome b561 domain-containing protein n=1 Tax=Pythium insidiosum TaxID=114742 RepID=A0AAD5LYY1_PYTIN|nr:hypothetical protein P43SY_004221 [Pythium insidiosum]